MSEHRTPEEVIRHYRDEIDEGQRITRGLGQLELLRTREIVRRHLPEGPLRVLEVPRQALHEHVHHGVR